VPPQAREEKQKKRKEGERKRRNSTLGTGQAVGGGGRVFQVGLARAKKKGLMKKRGLPRKRKNCKKLV